MHEDHVQVKLYAVGQYGEWLVGEFCDHDIQEAIKMYSLICHEEFYTRAN